MEDRRRYRKVEDADLDSSLADPQICKVIDDFGIENPPRIIH